LLDGYVFRHIESYLTMFGLFKSTSSLKITTETVVLKLSGLHCTSCSLNIDGTLEDTPGVIQSTTNYVKSQATIEFDPQKVTPDELKKIIKELGYKTET
jgi:copper chaperone CopZ